MQPKNLNYYDSVALEASAVVKASPGTLFSITGYNSSASDQFVQIHDAAALPADTAVPAIIFKVAAQENFYYELKEIARFFKNGITICNSSTVATKTIGVADCWFNVQYI
jgi:hypothetical protein